VYTKKEIPTVIKTVPWLIKKLLSFLSRWRTKIKPRTIEKTEQDTTKGQGLGFTRWKGCCSLRYLILLFNM